MYVCHMIDQLDQVDGPIDLLEYTTTNKESFVVFNKEGDKGVHERDKVVKKGVEVVILMKHQLLQHMLSLKMRLHLVRPHLLVLLQLVVRL